MENREEETRKKRNRGRQKIAIEKIANKNSLQVTFSKRRVGLFKKASELSILCGAQVAVIAQSPAGKVFSFGNPSVDSVIHRFETGEDRFNSYSEAHNKDKAVLGKSYWWDDVCLENLGLQELEECMAAMQVLKNNLLKRVGHRHDDLGMASSSSDVLIPNLTLDQFGGLPLQYYDRSS